VPARYRLARLEGGLAGEKKMGGGGWAGGATGQNRDFKIFRILIYMSIYMSCCKSRQRGCHALLRQI
jgi:hypothetical protein